MRALTPVKHSAPSTESGVDPHRCVHVVLPCLAVSVGKFADTGAVGGVIEISVNPVRDLAENNIERAAATSTNVVTANDGGGHLGLPAVTVSYLIYRTLPKLCYSDPAKRGCLAGSRTW